MVSKTIDVGSIPARSAIIFNIFNDLSMDRKELISSSAYWLAQFQIDFFRIVKEYQLINDLDKWQLQSDLDISEYTLNQILSGDAYLTFNEICKLSVKMNKAPKLTFVDLDTIK